MKTTMRGADGILDTLEAVDTELVVGYIGHTTQELADALLDREKLRSLFPATEMGGAHLINGYNIVRNRGAAVGAWHTVGTLLIAGGLYEGMFSRIPSLHLGFNVDGSFAGRDAMQEMQNVDLLKPVTRYATRVERPDKLPETVLRAYQRAHGAPAGPTFVDIPFDLTVDVAEMSIPRGWRAPSRRVGATAEEIDEAVAMLLAAVRPVLVVGGGAAQSGAAEEVRALAELLEIPVTTTHTAQGILPESHRLALGSSGPIGWSCANEAIKRADVVLVVGSRLSEWGYSQSYHSELPGRLIQIDTDSDQLGNFYFPELPIVGDARTVLAQLAGAISSHPDHEGPTEESAWVRENIAAKKEWVEGMKTRAADDTSPLSPWRVAKEIEASLDPRDRVVSDAGNNTGWIFQGMFSEQPGRLITTAGAGVLGAGYPMALGVKLADPDAHVVAALGDGGFGYSVNEIALAIREKINVTIVVFNDGALGANHGFMDYLYGRRNWTTLNNPDFVALAKAYGAAGERVEESGALADALRRGRESGTTYLIDVPVPQTFGYPSTGDGGAVKWSPRTWPSDTIGTKSPGRFDREMARSNND